VESIVQLVVAAFELVEAEGRMLREWLMKMVTAIALGIVIMLLSLLGLGFLLYSLYEYLYTSTFLSRAGAAAVFGAVALLLASVGAVTIKAIMSTRGHHGREQD